MDQQHRYSIWTVIVGALLLLPASGIAQALTGMSPNSGTAGQSLTVTISGTGTTFGIATGTNSSWLKQGSTVFPLNVNVQSATEYSSSLFMPCSAPQGAYDLFYADTDPATPYDTLTLAGAYTLSGSSIGTYGPTSVQQGGSVNITFSGACGGFQLSSSTIHNGWIDNGVDLVDLINVAWVSSNNVTGLLEAPCTLPTGQYDMYYSVIDPMTSTADTIAYPTPFTVNSMGNFAFNPGLGIQGDATNLTLTGICASTSGPVQHEVWITNGSNTITGTNVTVVSNGQISCELDILCEDAEGSYQVYHATYDPNTMQADTAIAAASFTIEGVISPNTGSPGSNLSISISGDGVSFQPGTSTINSGWLNLGGSQIMMANVQYNNPDWSADLNIPGGASDGYYDVFVSQTNTVTSISDTALLFCGFNIECITGCDSVWPGDANDDGLANNMDLLTLGMAFGNTGPARPAASLNWEAQYSPAWGTATPTLINNRHQDTDGDGTVSFADTVAILQNYGLMHAKTGDPVITGGDPTLFYVMPADTAGLGASISIPLHLGTAADPLGAAYGIAFTVTYNPALIDPATIDFNIDGSWLGTEGVNAITINHNDAGAGLLDVAITRIDQNDNSGFGQVGNLTFTTAGSLSTEALPLQLGLTSTMLIDNQGDPVAVIPATDTLIVINQPDYVPQIGAENPVTVYPNPFSTATTLSFPNARGQAFRLTVTDLTGKVVMQLDGIRGSKFRLEKGQLANGVYVTVLESDDARWVNRVIIE